MYDIYNVQIHIKIIYSVYRLCSILVEELAFYSILVYAYDLYILYTECIYSVYPVHIQTVIYHSYSVLVRIIELTVYTCVYVYMWASLVAQTVKRLPGMWETWVWSLGWEDPLEKGMATQSSTLAWKIPWTEEPGRLQSVHWVATSQIRLSNFTFTFTSLCIYALYVSVESVQYI